MFHRATAAILFAASIFTASPAFSQEEFYRQEVSGQAFGSFAKDTWQDGVKQKATDSGGALATYRYWFDKHNGLEANYGYSLNTQSYRSINGALGVKSYSNEATSAYVYRFPFKRYSLFALAGAGAIVFVGKDTPGIDHQARPVGVYGGGIDTKIPRQLFLRAEYRELIYNSPTWNVPMLAGMDRITHRFEPSVGFAWHF